MTNRERARELAGRARRALVTGCGLGDDAELLAFDDRRDGEDPPRRRFAALFRRPS